MTSTSDTRPAGRRGPTVVSNEAVYQCYVDLNGANPPIQATRKSVAYALSVPEKIIDEHTDRLFRAGRLTRVLPGVFEPTEKIENRAVSITDLPHGAAKVEIGDQVLDLQNMREGWIMLGLLKGWLEAKMRFNMRKIVDGTRS